MINRTSAGCIPLSRDTIRSDTSSSGWVMSLPEMNVVPHGDDLEIVCCPR